MIRRNKRRRGIVILVVLSLLVLFVLLAVSFAIVAGQYRRAAEAYARAERRGDSPDVVADRVMYELVRGTDTEGSPFRGNSLLRDMYGDSVESTLTADATQVADDQILRLYADDTALEDVSGFYNGCVLTFLSGPARNLSTRIIRTDPDDSNGYRLDVLAPKSDTRSSVLPENGDEILINGRPFSGTGFGYNSSTSAGQPRLEYKYACRTNWRDDDGASGDDVSDYEADYLAGGANESYDAPDYQNLVLGAVKPDAADSGDVLPSFHRRASINYFDSTYTSTWVDLKMMTLRPIPWVDDNNVVHNENFTGSNPDSRYEVDTSDSAQSLADLIEVLIDGPWDVDNDGDGVPDSIWMDPEYPVHTASDGRRYKVLVAPLCVDLDGRLNVNAHGNYSHVGGYDTPTAVTLARGTSSSSFADGQGYGPPEINLDELIDNSTEYENLLNSRYESLVDSTEQNPGASGFDPLSQFRFFDFPQNYFSGALRGFGSPPDLRGEFAFGIDYRGQPLYEYSGDPTNSAWNDLLTNSAYEFNLVEPSGNDHRFTVHDLERVLRPRDLDSSHLPNRLYDLVSVLDIDDTDDTDDAARRSITTDSYDPPVPSVLSGSGERFYSVAYWLRERLDAGVSDPDGEVAKMLSPAIDLALGLRMDLNRPFGNGRDDNGNRVVDESAPDADHTISECYANASGQRELVKAPDNDSFLMTLDHDNDGELINDTDAYMARQKFATNLYVLLMLLKDKNAHLDANGDGSTSNEETAGVLAQWAINVVDFRDPDSIMTPFEYDINPFNGWGVDGNLATNEGGERRFVWGCERPELLITETLAFHDRRTENTDKDSTGKLAADEDDGIKDYDQRLMPRGAFFVELYNPWTGHDRWPAEFYHDGSTWQDGVVLGKTGPGSSPIWRIVVTEEKTDQAGSEEPKAIDVEYAVYFTDPSSIPFDPDETNVYYSKWAADNNTTLAPLLPGRYAVVGPNGTTTIGRRTDADKATPDLGSSATRQIVLTPSSDYTGEDDHQVTVKNNSNPPADKGDAATVDSPTLPETPRKIQPAVAVPVDTQYRLEGGSYVSVDRSLNISEVADGYEDDPSVWDSSAGEGEGAYITPYDKPLDTHLPDPDPDNPPDDQDNPKNIVESDYRRVHLQRLANPLKKFDATDNPYLTIDSMPVDLTIYHGAESVGNNADAECFASFQRGTGDTDRQFWTQPDSTSTSGDDTEESPLTHEFDRKLEHSLGYLTTDYGPSYTSINLSDPSTNAPAPPYPFKESPHSINPAPDPDVNFTFYVGAPNTSAKHPFPWLVWNNRPFVSQMELLQVPRSSSSSLLADFAIAATTSPYAEEKATFNHLLNFFYSDHTADDATNLYRLFEYVHVPSRFSGADLVLYWSVFTQSGSAYDLLRPPFNKISHYRTPGKINVNTVYDEKVWDAVWNSHQSLPYTSLVETRRGYSTGSDLFEMNDAYPTFFAKPFRAPGSGDLVPRSNLQCLDIDCTLLRSNRIAPATTQPSQAPLLQNDYDPTVDTKYYACNSDRNSYFRYQGLTRLPNLLTTRSNVYAIWLTIGYFEVDEDGNLGQELGLDSGEVERHRAFYVVDRSIPVAFEPDENHNVDRCILLRRFIE